MLDEETSHLALYQFRSCPFCVRVRWAVWRRGLSIQLRDVRRDPIFLRELIQDGGRYQVPCLRITRESGENVWMYESADIVAYLDEHFGRR